MRFGARKAAPAGPVAAQVPLCVLCARDGLVVEGEALADVDRPEEGRLCETHLMAQEHAVETATGLHPADLWALVHGGELAAPCGGEHYFPEPEELGCDAESFPAGRGNCVCGQSWDGVR